MKDKSWVIRVKKTGKVLRETRSEKNKKLAEAHPELEVVGITKHLVGLNKKIKDKK